MYWVEVSAVGHCGFYICATWSSSSSLLTADLQTPDLGEHVEAVLVCVLLLAKLQYSSVRSEQKSEKLQKTAQTQTGVVSRLCGRWKQHKLKDKTGAALRNGEERLLFPQSFDETDTSFYR